MKCAACNYKYDEYNPETEQNESDDIERFEKIEGNFTIKKGYYNNILDEVYLYSCPKCGTIKMVKW